MSQDEREILDSFEEVGLRAIERALNCGQMGDALHTRLAEEWVAEKKAEIQQVEEEKRRKEREEDRALELQKLELDREALELEGRKFKQGERAIRVNKWASGASVVAVVVSIGALGFTALGYFALRTDSKLEERVESLESRVDSLKESPAEAPETPSQ